MIWLWNPLREYLMCCLRLLLWSIDCLLPCLSSFRIVPLWSAGFPWRRTTRSSALTRPSSLAIFCPSWSSGRRRYTTTVFIEHVALRLLYYHIFFSCDFYIQSPRGRLSFAPRSMVISWGSPSALCWVWSRSPSLSPSWAPSATFASVP